MTFDFGWFGKVAGGGCSALGFTSFSSSIQGACQQVIGEVAWSLFLCFALRVFCRHSLLMPRRERAASASCGCSFLSSMQGCMQRLVRESSVTSDVTA